MLKELFLPYKQHKGLLNIEIIAFGYNLLTAIVVLLLFNKMDHPAKMILDRLIFVAIAFAFIGISKVAPCKFTFFLRIGFHVACLSYWYSDTFEFNRLLNNLDNVFASVEQFLFNSQPSIWLSQKFPQTWINEMLCLGYISYFPMIGITTLWCFFYRYKALDKTTFIILSSFFFYYIVFILVPVAGPQFYFPAIGIQNVEAHHFPAIGTFFNSNPELICSTDKFHGFFHDLVEASQKVGERPTAAFPSSHVSLSTIIMILSWKNNKHLFYFFLPFYLLLCTATVFIQAHYLIDAIAGFVTAFFVYGLMSYLYNTYFAQNAV